MLGPGHSISAAALRAAKGKQPMTAEDPRLWERGDSGSDDGAPCSAEHPVRQSPSPCRVVPQRLDVGVGEPVLQTRAQVERQRHPGVAHNCS